MTANIESLPRRQSQDIPTPIRPDFERLSSGELLAQFKDYAAHEAYQPYNFNNRPSVTDQPVLATAAHEMLSAEALHQVNADNSLKVLPHRIVSEQLQAYYRDFPTVTASDEIRKDFGSNRNRYVLEAIKQEAAYPEVHYARRLFVAAQASGETLIARALSDYLAACGMTLEQLHLTVGAGVIRRLRLTGNQSIKSDTTD